MIEQAQATLPAAVDHAKEVYGLVAIFLTQIGLYLTSRHTGNKKDGAARAELTRQLKPINEGLANVSSEVRDLKAHVIGPDGQNGLRSEVRELRDDVRGLLDRERLHGPYDRRS